MIAGSHFLRAARAGFWCLLGLASASAAVERMEPAPKQLEEVGITERLDASLPLQLVFSDEQGNEVALGSFFEPNRPVILTLNYYECPMLCTLQLNGLVEALKELDWTPGREFEIVTVSIDPREKPELAKAKKEVYLGLYGRPGASAGWHFLTGTGANIATLADAVGFRYRYDEKTRQFAHAAAAFILTPDGRLSRYLYGIEYSPRTVRLSLVEAAGGRIGSSFDRLLLYCYHYDASQGRYTMAAVNIMRLGGLLTVVAILSLVGGYWLREARARKRKGT